MDIANVHQNDKEVRAIELLEKVGLDQDQIHRRILKLSGGQQQRALLARALCATTKLLILDEPVTGLDPVASADMYNLVKNLYKEGITVIMVSHDITAAVNNATKILHLTKDNYFFGSTHQYLHSDVGKNTAEQIRIKVGIYSRNTYTDNTDCKRCT